MPSISLPRIKGGAIAVNDTASLALYEGEGGNDAQTVGTVVWNNATQSFWQLQLSNHTVDAQNITVFGVTGNYRWVDTGPGGIPGTVFRTGSGAPSNALGINTDLYLDTGNGNIYSKAAGAYTVMTVGTPTTQYRTGFTAVDNSVGVDGDLFMDVTTGNIKKRTAGAYVFAGLGSIPGNIHRIGVDVPLANMGEHGDTAMNIATGNFHLNTNGTWSVLSNASLPGSTFRTGTGVPSNGLGVDGDTYLDTASGITYKRAAGTYSALPAPSSSPNEAMFYGLTAGTGNGGASDYAATVAVKTSVGTGRVPFPRLGPSLGSSPPVAFDGSSITLPAIGKYEITAEVHTTEPGQLQIELDGVDVPESVATNMNPTSGGHEFGIFCVVTTVATNRKLAIVNCAGNAAALTVTPANGSQTHASAQRLVIKQIA